MRATLLPITILIWLLFAAVSAVAGQTAAASPTPAVEHQENDRLPFMVNTESNGYESAPSVGGLALRTLGALLLIVGLIVAAGWGLKRVGGARLGATQKQGPTLEVLSTMSLGDKRSLSLVRFAERTLLLGATPQTVTLLAETGFHTSEPPIRSVAELLREDEPSTFADELLNATRALDHLGHDAASRKGESV